MSQCQKCLHKLQNNSGKKTDWKKICHLPLFLQLGRHISHPLKVIDAQCNGGVSVLVILNFGSHGVI